jgi:hypothetical protein
MLDDVEQRLEIVRRVNEDAHGAETVTRADRHLLIGRLYRRFSFGGPTNLVVRARQGRTMLDDIEKSLIRILYTERQPWRPHQIYFDQHELTGKTAVRIAARW